MRLYCVPHLLFLAASALVAAPDAPQIEVPKPVVVPAPLPPPGAVLSLPADRLYVAQSKTEFVVRDHPKGLVRVTYEKGPLRIRAKFADGSGFLETKNYDGPYLAFVEAVAKGRAELDFIPLGLKGEADIVAATVDVDGGEAPRPPPEPDPKPGPKPEPRPDPPKVASVWVIVVEDVNGSRTVETARVLNDPFWAALKPKHDWRHYVNTSKPAVDNGYVREAEKVGYPAVLVLNAKDGDLLKAFKLTTAKAIKDAVAEVTK